MGYLTGKAISPESARLVKAIADLVASKEVRERQRGASGTEKLRRAVVAFAADLLSIHPAPVFIVTNNAAMTGMEVKADTFRQVLTAMIAAGLVEKRAGFRTKGAEWTLGAATSFGPSWAPRFWPTAKLLRLAEAEGVIAPMADHFKRPPPPVNRDRSVLIRGRSSGQWKVKGKRQRLVPSERLERLQDEVMEVNRALASADVQGCDQPILYRSFTLTIGSEDVPALHGRYYANGSSSYIAMRRDKRRGITMHGETVAEVDVSASFFWCFYGAARRLGIISATPPPGSDLYAVGDLPRAAVKAFMTATWGNGKLAQRWPKGTRKKLAEEGIKLTRYPIAKVREEVLKVHPILRRLDDVVTAAGLHLLEPEEPHKLCPHWLMGIEAEAVTRALLRLLREDAVTAMPLHDCLIVPARMADAAVYRLKEAYREVAGVEPVVKVKGHGE
ncbi:MAG TPA: hypothetical protein VGN83_28120 [Falsiroseomonas sp.]|jgi:hypothetical protein|nr:hypothetical protein [Falsiroseomonas sp.]